VISLSSLRRNGVICLPVTHITLAFFKASDIAASMTLDCNAYFSGIGTANNIPVLMPNTFCVSTILAASLALETLHGVFILSEVSEQ